MLHVEEFGTLRTVLALKKIYYLSEIKCIIDTQADFNWYISLPSRL